MQTDPQTHAIIGAAMEVHRNLGHGFLEPVYQEALSIEFQLREIPFQREVQLPIMYKDRKLSCLYRVDFVCFNDVIVELKAICNMGNSEQSQVINYLKASDKNRGLLLNFGNPSLQYKRVVLSR
jgi:GxxExxY protein